MLRWPCGGWDGGESESLLRVQAVRLRLASKIRTGGVTGTHGVSTGLKDSLHVMLQRNDDSRVCASL